MKHVVRWAIDADFEGIAEIERLAWGQNAWSEEDFVAARDHPKCVLNVVDFRQEVAGFAVRMIEKHGFVVTNLAVRPKFRRIGVAGALTDALRWKLSLNGRWRYCDFHVREGALDGQLFLRSQGIKAIGTDRDYYEDTHEDAIIFRMAPAGVEMLSHA